MPRTDGKSAPREAETDGLRARAQQITEPSATAKGSKKRLTSALKPFTPINTLTNTRKANTGENFGSHGMTRGKPARQKRKAPRTMPLKRATADGKHISRANTPVEELKPIQAII